MRVFRLSWIEDQTIVKMRPFFPLRFDPGEIIVIA